MPAYGSIDAGFAGLLINGEDFIDGTMIAKDSTGIAFGAPVFALEGDEVSAYAATGSNRHLRGVAVHTHKDYAGSGKYNQYDAVGVLRSGRLFVPAASTVTANVAAYWDATNNVWTNVTTGGTFQTPYFFRTNYNNGLAELDVMKSPAALVG